MPNYLPDIKKIAAFIVGCFFLYSCENDPKLIEDFNKKKAGVEVAKKVVVNYSIAGKRKAILTSPLMYRVQDTVPYVEFPNLVHVDFYNEKNSDSVESKLDAHYAKYKETQSLVFLKDSVRVISIKGDTLYCDELYWDIKKIGAEFYTDKPVRIRTKTEIINGIGMQARQDFKEYYIIHPIGTIKVRSSEFPD